MRTLILLALFAGALLAGEKHTLTFKDGKKKNVTLVGFDEEGLDADYGGSKLRIAWSELKPDSAYKACAKLTPYDDGTKILDLSGFARKLQLFPEAIEQLEIALALGALDEAAYEKLFAQIRKEEVAHLCATIDTLLKAKAPPADTLAAIKRLKERYPAHEANQKYEPHIQALVAQLAEKAQAEQDAEAKKLTDKRLIRLHKQISKEQAKKQKAIEKADELVKEADPAIALRQVARVKRKLVEPQGAEKYYKRARKHLRKVARLDPQFLVVDKREVQKEYEAIENKLVDCYLKVARILLKERNYKGAVEYVRAVLMYDPINEEALEMAEEIRANRINFKLSEVTNTRPRVTGG